MNERMRFVVRHEAGERMVDLCREFGVSRKTGYKYWNRYKEHGPEGLGDFSRRPHRAPNQTPDEIIQLAIAARLAHPTWGPRKLRVVLKRQHPGISIPAASTIGTILSRNDLVPPRRVRRRAAPTPVDKLTPGTEPNEVWCADYKGQFRMGNRQYCYPLTITDQHTRMVLSCEALENTRTDGAMAAFAACFREFGLPKVIRTDNGSPFASTGLHGLTALSAWWMRMGIEPERIEPGHPEQNGRHERMHLTLKQDATRPPGAQTGHMGDTSDPLRAPSAERRAPNHERRTTSAEPRATSAERRAPSHERRAPSPERRIPFPLRSLCDGDLSAASQKLNPPTDPPTLPTSPSAPPAPRHTPPNLQPAARL